VQPGIPQMWALGGITSKHQHGRSCR
jgi:hypothetical protein